MTGSWLTNRTVTAEFDCPWTDQTVTVQLLTCNGRPVGVVACSGRNCELQCLRAKGEATE